MTQVNPQVETATASAPQSPAAKYDAWKRDNVAYASLSTDDQKIWDTEADRRNREKVAERANRMKEANRVFAKIGDDSASTLGHQVILALSGSFKNTFTKEEKASARSLFNATIQRLKDSRPLLEEAITRVDDFIAAGQGCLDTAMETDAQIILGTSANKAQMMKDVLARAKANAKA